VLFTEQRNRKILVGYVDISGNNCYSVKFFTLAEKTEFLNELAFYTGPLLDQHGDFSVKIFLFWELDPCLNFSPNAKI